MDSVKCNICREVKFEKEFIKNGKTLKSCNTCRGKKKDKDKEKEIDISVIQINEVMPINEIIPINEVVPKGWIRLSGTWIERGGELALHQKFTRKLIREFKRKSAPYIHKLFTRYLMTDIKDLYISD